MTEVKCCFDIDKETERVVLGETENMSKEELQAMYDYTEKINKKFEEELKAKGGKTWVKLSGQNLNRQGVTA